MKTMKPLRFIVAVGLTLSVGIIGGIFTSTTTEWYLSLNKPVFQPPGWLFAPVWTLLYLLMGYSLFIIWQKGTEGEKIGRALTLFFIQLAVNGVWSFIFFTAQNVLLALVDILILWLLLIFTIRAFRQISRKAGLLLVPYFIWVTFATVLNFTILIMN